MYSIRRAAYLNVDAKKMGVEFKPLAVFKKTRKENPNEFIDDIWHHATLTAEGLVPSNDWRYNDHSYELDELCSMIKTYGIKPGYYPNFWDELEIIGAKTGINYADNDEELLKFCIAYKK